MIRHILGLGRKDDIATIVCSTGTADICYNAAASVAKLLTFRTLATRRHEFLQTLAEIGNAAVVELGCGWPPFDKK